MLDVTSKELNELHVQGKLEEVTIQCLTYNLLSILSTFHLQVHLDKNESSVSASEKCFGILMTVSDVLMDSEADRTASKTIQILAKRKVCST